MLAAIESLVLLLKLISVKPGKKCDLRNVVIQHSQTEKYLVGRECQQVYCNDAILICVQTKA